MKTASIHFWQFLKYIFIHSLTDCSACQMEAEWRPPRELSPHNDRYSTKECLLMVVFGAFWLMGHHSQTTSSQTGNSSSEGKFHYSLILYQQNWCFSKGKSEADALWLDRTHESNLVVYFYLLIWGSKQKLEISHLKLRSTMSFEQYPYVPTMFLYNNEDIEVTTALAI